MTRLSGDDSVVSLSAAWCVGRNQTGERKSSGSSAKVWTGLAFLTHPNDVPRYRMNRSRRWETSGYSATTGCCVATPRTTRTFDSDRAKPSRLSDGFDLAGELGVVEVRVVALAGEQFEVVSLLHDPAAVHDENCLGVPDRGEAVRDDEAGPL